MRPVYYEIISTYLESPFLNKLPCFLDASTSSTFFIVLGVGVCVLFSFLLLQ